MYDYIFDIINKNYININSKKGKYIINTYIKQIGGISKNINLVYMAKPIYGGWVSFTSHLCLKLKETNNCNLYKITKRSENKLRDYGYNIQYNNKNINDLIKLPNLLITAIDKNYYKYLDFFPDNTIIVIHDPTEVKINSSSEVIKHLHRFKVITIRKTVKDYLKNKFNINSDFLYHPFYPYPKTINKNKNNIVSISRIDYDKNIDILLKANKLLSNIKKIKIYGSKNDLYVYIKLKDLDSMDRNDKKSAYKGTFTKSFKSINNILSNAKFVVDLSSIKNDGGGTQYTFLEAIYQDCVIILNQKWIEGTNSIFKNGVNCITVSNEFELVDILVNTNNTTLNKILKNSKKILEKHVNVKWNILFN